MKPQRECHLQPGWQQLIGNRQVRKKSIMAGGFISLKCPTTIRGTLVKSTVRQIVRSSSAVTGYCVAPNLALSWDSSRSGDPSGTVLELWTWNLPAEILAG